MYGENYLQSCESCALSIDLANAYRKLIDFPPVFLFLIWHHAGISNEGDYLWVFQNQQYLLLS